MGNSITCQEETTAPHITVSSSLESGFSPSHTSVLHLTVMMRICASSKAILQFWGKTRQQQFAFVAQKQPRVTWARRCYYSLEVKQTTNLIIGVVLDFSWGNVGFLLVLNCNLPRAISRVSVGLIIMVQIIVWLAAISPPTPLNPSSVEA